jgi:stalled ribosome alternative rescue factor ArfA
MENIIKGVGIYKRKEKKEKRKIEEKSRHDKL